MPGTPAEQTLSIPASALRGHLNHGDTIGACPVKIAEVKPAAQVEIQPEVEPEEEIIPEPVIEPEEPTPV